MKKADMEIEISVQEGIICALKQRLKEVRGGKDHLRSGMFHDELLKILVGGLYVAKNPINYNDRLTAMEVLERESKLPIKLYQNDPIFCATVKMMAANIHQAIDKAMEETP